MRHLAFLASLFLPSLLWAQDIVERRVQFASGASGTRIEGNIKGYEMIDYLLGASAGQVMNIQFSTSNPSSYFNLLQGNDPNAIHVGSTGGNTFDGVLPSSGDYRIRVYLMRNAARRDETANYSLSVSISGGGLGAATGNADFADSLSGGPDWWEVSGLTTGDTLNVRAGPGTGNAIIGALGDRDIVRNLGCTMNGSTRWCRIEMPGDQSFVGWVAGRYLIESAAPGTSSDQATPQGTVGADTTLAEQACKEALASIANAALSDIVVFDILESESGIGVMMTLAGAEKPWSCLADQSGNVQGITYTGEG